MGGTPAGGSHAFAASDPFGAKCMHHGVSARGARLRPAHFHHPVAQLDAFPLALPAFVHLVDEDALTILVLLETEADRPLSEAQPPQVVLRRGQRGRRIAGQLKVLRYEGVGLRPTQLVWMSLCLRPRMSQVGGDALDAVGRIVPGLSHVGDVRMDAGGVKDTHPLWRQQIEQVVDRLRVEVVEDVRR
eukprot:795963-Prymnesium_polylepis.2